jgi:hypothetical protein
LTGPHDPEFGVDPEDSARLLELRDAIDAIGWRNKNEEDNGDYVKRLDQIREELSEVDTLRGRCIRLEEQLKRQRKELRRFNAWQQRLRAP